MFNKLRQRFEKCVLNSEPAVIIMISVIAVVYTTAFAIFLVSLAFGLQDILIQEVKYILITPLLLFATVVFLAVMEKLWIVTTTRVMPRFIKRIDNFVERIENHVERTKNRKEPRESHIERMAKKFDDETLDLIVNKSQSYSIAMWHITIGRPMLRAAHRARLNEQERQMEHQKFLRYKFDNKYNHQGTRVGEDAQQLSDIKKEV